MNCTIRNVFDVGFSLVQRPDLCRINVDPYHGHTAARKLQRQRQADITEADDGDFFHRTDIRVHKLLMARSFHFSFPISSCYQSSPYLLSPDCRRPRKFYYQHIHLCTQKAIEGLLRATHHRFVFVEGSIQNDGNGSQAAEFRDQRRRRHSEH